MKKLSLLLILCLALSMLPGAAFAEEPRAGRVDAAPGLAVGDTGAMGLVAEDDGAEAPEPEIADWAEDGEIYAPPEEAAVEAAPEDLPTEIAAGAEGETPPEEPPAETPEATPHYDPDNGPQLAATEVTLGVGESFALNPAMPVGREMPMTCGSSDEAVATVTAEGVITAAGIGDARVTVLAQDGAYVECQVHVLQAPDVVLLRAEALSLGKSERYEGLVTGVGSVPGAFAGAYSLVSSNPSVVSVDADGALNALRGGKATVTATTYNNVSASCAVTVTKAPTKITVAADKELLGVGETGLLTCTLSKGSASQIAYVVEDETVLAVDPATGAMTGLAPGKTRVFMSTFNGLSDSVEIEVAPAPQSVAFPEKTFKLGVGMIVPPLALLDEGAAGEITYALKKQAVAVYKDGLLKGVKKGKTTLTATTYNGLTAKCTLKVVAPPKEVKLPYTELNLGVKQAFRLKPSVGKSASTYTYSTSNKKIVAVSEDGVVKGLRRGSATITVTTYNKKTVKLKVNVIKAPTSVSVTPKKGELSVGESVQLAWTFPKDTMGSVSFTSSKPDVLAVDEEGYVTAVGPGKASVTVKTHNGKKAKAVFVVYPKPVWIEPAESFIELGTGMGKALEYTLSPGSRSPLKYTSKNPDVAVVAANGTILAKGSGTTVITVSTNAEGVSCEITVKVWPAPGKISFDTTELTLDVGTSTKLLPVMPNNTMAQLTYASSDEAVATVDEDGTLTALDRGSAKITVTTHNGKTASLKLTVVDPDYPDSLTLENAPDYMEVGEELQLLWTVVPETADPDLVWTSSNPSVAVVEEDGFITAVGFGYTKISAKSLKNPDIAVEFTLAVETDNVTLAIPARTTNVAGISKNLAMINAIRVSAINQIKSMVSGGVISSTDGEKRQSMVNNAFKDYAFPWMTPTLQKYWKAENSEGGVKDFKPDRVYYGLPYISGSGTNRQYNAAKALNEGRFTDSGKGYYLLNQSKPLNGKYCGNDCSCFVDAAIWGTNSSHSDDRTSDIAVSGAYRTISDFRAMRTGDLICKGYAHVVMFLYYANADKTKIMIIENGGVEPGTNTVHCIVMDTSFYTKGGYSVRRLNGLG